MASTSYVEAWGDSQPTNKPPYFNGANYAYWKNIMKLFLQAFDLEAWKIIVSGYTTPITEMDTWGNEESKKFSINAKAMHLLFCALGPDRYGRVSSCSNAKEIWDKLEVTHEGTNELKETKIKIINLNYENDSSGDDEDEEMTLFAKRFKRFMKSNHGKRFQRREGFKNEHKERDPIICYECKKPGHIKFNCPNLRNKEIPSFAMSAKSTRLI